MEPAVSLPSDLLLTVAEVAIAILGFAAIVVALRGRSGDQRDDLMTRTRLRIMIEASSAALGASFFPFVFAATEFSTATTVLVSHLFLAATSVAILLVVFVRQKKRFGNWILPESWLFDTMGLSIATCLVALVCARAFGYLPQLGFGPYIGCLFFYLTVAIYVFVRIVFFASSGRMLDLSKD